MDATSLCTRGRGGASRPLGWSLAVVLAAACGGPTASGGDAETAKDASADDVTPPAEGGTGTEAYGNCVGSPRRIDDDACAGPLTCLPGYSAAGQAQFCTPRCDEAMDGADCPRAPAGTTARVICRAGDPPNPERYCALSCQFDRAGCPRGMVCFGGFICAWPR